MSVQTEHYPLETEWDFTERGTQSPFTVRAVSLALTKQDDELIECRLAFCANPELYQHIDKEALFNLTPDVRTPLSGVAFLPAPDIAIDISLKPDCLSHLAAHAATIDEAATYLLHVRHEQPNSPLLSTDNWVALSVTQHQESGETGYRTVWSYLGPPALSGDASSSPAIAEGITNFFKDVVGSRLDTVAQAFSQDTLGTISHFFQEVTHHIPEGPRQDNTSPQPIFHAVVHFFTQDDWTFTRMQGENALRLGVQGEHGMWDFYAHVREEEEQCIFYSICPIRAPESTRAAVAEFLTRANDGLMVGNFEMDFANGEMRYKTSIDIDGKELTVDIIQRLVYTNVTMMDTYLPGILAVIERAVPPVEAIAHIEA